MKDSTGSKQDEFSIVSTIYNILVFFLIGETYAIMYQFTRILFHNSIIRL